MESETNKKYIAWRQKYLIKEESHVFIIYISLEDYLFMITTNHYVSLVFYVGKVIR